MKNFFGSAFMVLTFFLFMPLMHTWTAYQQDNNTYRYPDCPEWDHVTLRECAERDERDRIFMQDNIVRENYEIAFSPTLFSFFLAGLIWWAKVLAVITGLVVIKRILFGKTPDDPDDDINVKR